MKKLIKLFIYFILLFLAVYFSLGPLTIFFLKKQLSSIFVASQVNIGASKFRPLSGLSLFDLRVTRGPLYDFKIKEIEINYNLKSLVRGNIQMVSLRQAALAINPGQENILLKVQEIKSQIALLGHNLSFYPLSGRILEAEFLGRASLNLGQDDGYSLDLDLFGLYIDSLIRDAKLEEKLDMTGKMSGRINLKGRGAQITMLKGDFSVAAPGGTLTVKDGEYLKDIARSSNQPVDLLVESFKNYKYNIGNLKVTKRGRDLVFEIALEAEAGKRNLSVVMHDFN